MTLHKGVSRPKRRRNPRDDLLRAATDLFLQKGYARTSIDDVISVAGGSKATLAKYFGNKAGLFEASVIHAAETVLVNVEAAEHIDSVEAALFDYGKRMLTFYLDPASLLIYRSLIMNLSEDDTAARAFYDKGHGKLVGRLSDILERFAARGEIVTADPFGDAQRFLHLIRAGIYEETLIGLRDGAQPDEIDGFCRKDLFRLWMPTLWT